MGDASNNSGPGPEHAIAIELADVTKTFAGRGSTQPVTALDRVNLAVPECEVVCVVGPSGCGKTTLLQLLAGFESPTTGQVLRHGVPVEGIDRQRLMVFQAPVLFPWMTVSANLRVVGKADGVDELEVEKRAAEILSEVGLNEFADHYPYELSGGMRQRVQLARALTVGPEILLLDEPFGALDAQTRLTMQELLQEIVQRHRPTIIFITHDIEEALFVGDRVHVMSPRPGRIVESVSVPWDRPRTLDMLTNEGFLTLKTRLLHRIREPLESGGHPTAQRAGTLP